MSKTRVVPFARLNLKVYGYTLPDTGSHQGLVKVGETIKEDVLQRIRNQVGTAGLRYNLLFERRAKHKDGHPFRDTDLHSYYKIRGIKQALRETGATEWFDFKDISLAEQMTDDFINFVVFFSRIINCRCTGGLYSACGAASSGTGHFGLHANKPGCGQGRVFMERKAKVWENAHNL